MSLLRALDLLPARAGADVLPAPLALDEVRGLLARRGGDVRRIGAHVGDETVAAIAGLDALVELLGDLHRLPRAVAEAGGGRALQRRGDERRLRIALLLLLLDRADDVGLPAQLLDERRHVLLGGELRLLAINGLEFSLELLAPVGLKQRADGPPLDRHEGRALPLAIGDQTQRHRLDAPGRQSGATFPAASADLLPEHWAERVADEAVEDAARLLRVHAVHVYLARVLQRVQHRLARDLVKLDAPGRAQPQLIHDVPRDRLSLAVRVSREVDLVNVLQRLLELADRPLARDDVGWLEVALEVYAHPAFGKVADMAHRSDECVIIREEARERARLGWRLDNDGFFGRHVIIPTTQPVRPFSGRRRLVSL